MAKFKKLKASELMAQGHTRCYWCRRAVVPHDSENPTRPLGATIDHIRSRPECVKLSEWIDPKNKVLACYECNQRRSREWVAKFQAGEVFRTPFAERSKTNYNEARRVRAEKQEANHRKQIAENLARRRVHIVVPSELTAAWEP